MPEYWTNGMATLYQADARELPLADKSVHCAVTSPPYWGLRDYGLGNWQGGIGLEPRLGEWVENIVAVGREVWRVLRDDGTWWLNLGDAYSGSGKHSTDHANPGISKAGYRGGDIASPPQSVGLPSKNLMGQPWRVAFALQDDGWILRSAIVWHKPNPMPESVRDRPTNAYEMVFLLSKQGRYFYDAEATRTPWVESSIQRLSQPTFDSQQGGPKDPLSGNRSHRKVLENLHKTGKQHGSNARNVWKIPTQGRSDAHFATFPDDLPRRCIMAGTSERGVCADCAAPWVRVVEHKTAGGPTGGQGRNGDRKDAGMGGFYGAESQTRGWIPTCDCNADTVPATVLDCFAGSGTTLAVAQSLGRRSVGTDLNIEYLEIARRYISKADGITFPLGL